MYLRDSTLEAIENHLGVKIDRELGEGAFGTAYLLSDGRVLKLTEDDSEYASAMIIKSLDFKYVVKIFDIFKFQVGNRIFYGLIKEYVETPQTLKDFINEGQWHFPSSKVMASSLQKYYDSYVQSIPEKFKHWFDQVYEMHKEWFSADIPMIDFHSGNIGLVNNMVKIFDVGASGTVVEESKAIILEE